VPAVYGTFEVSLSVAGPGRHRRADGRADPVRAEVRARDPVAVSQPAGAVSPGVCLSAGSVGTSSSLNR
jgi:hypothetical protein